MFGKFLFFAAILSLAPWIAVGALVTGEAVIGVRALILLLVCNFVYSVGGRAIVNVMTIARRFGAH